jgi:diadenosine tetraphosphate (Ap4A) HIT family hydrolase
MCPLCSPSHDTVIYSNDLFRIILVDDIPGFVRIITKNHIKELGDLKEIDYLDVMRAVYKVEKAMIKVLHPDKVNIASLGNYVPHQHIHIIPRYRNDAWFPDTIWSPKVREYKYPTTPEQIDALIYEIIESFK